MLLKVLGKRWVSLRSTPSYVGALLVICLWQGTLIAEQLLSRKANRCSGP
ncbi:hypothetical protein HNP46_003046 [Pseudomonas nitritireducens]|uniref:Uncharacterized protein n=1 Tax=Pseudomonas nitroreducens TaxID=46680 RepID=A0A7W7KJX2_PSENT|nr:hypothetical protein [Pseudomonas nitritireducens]